MFYVSSVVASETDKKGENDILALNYFFLVAHEVLVSVTTATANNRWLCSLLKNR